MATDVKSSSSDKGAAVAPTSVQLGKLIVGIMFTIRVTVGLEGISKSLHIFTSHVLSVDKLGDQTRTLHDMLAQMEVVSRDAISQAYLRMHPEVRAAMEDAIKKNSILNDYLDTSGLVDKQPSVWVEGCIQNIAVLPGY